MKLFFPPTSVRELGLVALVLAVLFAGASLHAEPGIHELHITPGIESAPLSLASWLVPSDTPYQVEVLSPPQFGFFDGESFAPTEEFWLAGGDQMTLRLSYDQIDWDHTIYLTPLRAEPSENSESLVDFEDAEIPDHWVEDSADAVFEIVSANGQPEHVLSGQYSLLATILEDGGWGSYGYDPASFLKTNPGPLGAGADAANGYGGTLLVPPDDPFDGAVTNLVAYLSPYYPYLPQVFVQTQPIDEEYFEMRAVLSNDVSCFDCETDWFRVPANEVIRFEIWSGSRATGLEQVISDRSWALRFSITSPEDASTTAWLEEKVPIGVYRVGAMNSVGMDGFRVSFDRFWITHEQHLYEPRKHLGAGFEDGGLGTGWESRGDMSTSSNKPIAGDWSLQMDQVDLGVAGFDTVVVDKNPDAATELSAQLTFKLNDLELPENGQLELIKAANNDELAGGQHLSLILQRYPTGYRLRARARDDGQVLRKTPWFPLAGNTHRAVMHWRASSASGANDGRTRLFVDGALVGEVLGIDNDTKVIESVAYGAFNVHQSTATFPPPGSCLRIDDVVSFH